MRAVILLVGLLLAVPAVAQTAASPEPTPEVVALVQLWREAQQREAAAVLRAVIAERRLDEAQRAAPPAEPPAAK